MTFDLSLLLILSVGNGTALAIILLVPGIATIWAAREKFIIPVAPDPLSLSLTGLGALVVNFSCAVMLTRYRHHSGSLTRPAFLSARNDAFAKIAIIAAGLPTAFVWRSACPTSSWVLPSPQ